jgi:tRNA(fMet)-specific endonuclease VapC
VSRYLLDTSVCIELIRGRHPQVRERLGTEAIADVFLSAITLSELEYGVQRSRDPTRNRLALLSFLIPLEVLPFDEAAAVEYGAVRADLEARGMPIGAMDLLIAAHARALGLIVVTGNVSEFARVPALQVEDWR